MKNFYWGSATSSHQVEGGTRNDWSEWEKRNADRLAREARKKWAPWQREKFPEMFDAENYISGLACDHYNRYEEDFDLAREGGHNAHRFSIEWSRVEPEEGAFDEKAIEHYRNVVQALRARGLEPFVTLWHWTLPVWLANRGGVLAKDFPELFARYATKMADAFGKDVTFYMTVNEPNSVIYNGYTSGDWPPQKKNPFLALRAYTSLARAHKEAYRQIKERWSHAQVGLTEIFSYFDMHRADSFWNKMLGDVAWKWGNDQFLSRISGAYDFLGVQNYFTHRIGLAMRKNSDKQKVSDLGWELRADVLGELLRQCSRYDVPLYVTEDGLADADDTKRGTYIAQRIASMRKAMRDGIDVRGYFHWSLLDNFEWDKGFWPRFGLIEVDRKTLERKPRESFRVYQEMITRSF